MDKLTSKYEQRGVSSDKNEVHEAIKKLDKGLYPSAFCKILPDVIANSPEHCCVMHGDTAGTKTSLAYVYWKETNDFSVWKNIAQDALIMNLDDMACVGMTNNFTISSNIARNKHLIPGAVLTSLIEGTHQLLEEFRELGIDIYHSGGETADVGDIVRTLDVGFTAFARTERKKILVNNVKPGSVIVGLASYGQSTYEKSYNSGMGCNGLTSARHDVLNKKIKEKYPESFDTSMDDSLAYVGTKNVDDIDSKTGLIIGKLLLSPTRTFIPVIKQVLEKHFNQIQGMIHCTGGGQTKVMKFVDNVHIIKNNLLPVPPVFELIQQESQTSWQEMYKTFNMGTRLEIYTDEKTAHEIIAISKSFQIDAQIIGYCEEFTGKKLSIQTAQGTYTY